MGHTGADRDSDNCAMDPVLPKEISRSAGMSLRHILLGLLKQPSSGYQIKQSFDRVFKHFWSAKLAQIYPTLNRLEADGLARSEQQASAKGPARRVYSRTDSGAKLHLQWLRDGPTIGMDRLPYLTQVFFLSDLPAPERASYFRQLRAHFVAELAELRAVDEGWAEDDSDYPDQLNDEAQCIQFTLRLGLNKIAANVAWCDECIAVIEAASVRDSLAPSPGGIP